MKISEGEPGPTYPQINLAYINLKQGHFHHKRPEVDQILGNVEL